MATPTAQPDGPAPSQPPPRYVPPHRNGTVGDLRYSKDQLLDFFRAQQSADGGLKDGLSHLYVGGWQPETANGASSAGWGRAEHSRDSQPGPDVCWDRDGGIEPLGLSDMDDEEKEFFSTSVNSLVSRQPAGVGKDGQANGHSGRKTSISAGTPGGYGLPSPSATRTFGRRRETGESYPFPSNPLASPTREDQRAPSPPPSLMRRRTDLKDSKPDDHERDADEKAASTPFGTLKRNPTGPLSAGFGAPSSPWSAAPQGASMSPMGSFGNFGLGGPSGTPTTDKRPALGSGRVESRFKNVLNKDGHEDVPSPTVQRKGSMSNLPRVNENESWRPQDDVNAALAEAEEEAQSGSAALAGGADLSSPQSRQGLRGFGTPSRSNTLDEGGLGAFGMTMDNALGSSHGFLQGRDAFQQTPAAQRSGLMMGGGNDPMSPTNTNPYRSPEQFGVDRLTEDPDGLDMHNAPLPGLGGFGQDAGHQMGGFQGLGGLQHLGRAPGMQMQSVDRGQIGTPAGGRGFQGLGGLGQMGGVSGAAAWPTTQPGFGTPIGQTAGLSNAFGGGIFATSTAEMQSPSLAGLGGLGQGGQGFGGSRMASMFPPAMQDQMRHGDFGSDQRDGSNERPAAQPFGGLDGGLDNLRSPFAGQAQNAQAGDALQSQFGPPGQMSQGMEQPSHAAEQLGQQIAQPPSSASNQPPAPQQKTMVMPDRMRWIYRDPQGQTQGPWTGLEMHDWYKAGFFSPELLVKKYEDTDYEPLAQLIRRIGNSREPFLVPQIGIPHGAVSNNGPTAWAGAGGAGPSASTGPAAMPSTANAASAGGVQPPFASSFPSFGTTLTADQQNALERRKQEEQYLMARQKEHLAQAQMAQRMQPPNNNNGNNQHGLAPSGGGGGGQLHHHSSVQSLHSQPSFGSMTSPNAAFQPSPSQGPAGSAGHAAGFFDNSFRSPQGGGLGAVGAGVDSLGHIREEEIPGIMDRLSMAERAGPGQFGAPGQPFGQQQQQQQHGQQVQQMYEDRARLQQEQAQHDAAQQHKQGEQPGQNERLQQFQQLQGQGLEARFQPAIGKPAASTANAQRVSAAQSSVASPAFAQQQPQEPLSLTEQVEAAVSAQQSPAPPQTGLPQPFPPAPSQSPLPAPSAQRTGRQSVADQLQTESREMSQTPSVDTPSAAIAPWAKEPAEAAKGPSLKQIQEVEAKKAAEVEALAAAARRAAAEREREMEALTQVVPVQPGLPSSASWGTTGAVPATPTSATSAAWTKAAQKPAAVGSKSMAQIQKEEEARKKRQAAAAVAAQVGVLGAVAAPAGGKSYANLAGKVTAPAPGVGGVWTTVGAGGKSKTPAPAPAPAAPAVAARTASSGVAPSALQAPVAVRKAPSRTSTLNNADTVNAQEEFRKWAVGELRPDLGKNISGKPPHPPLLKRQDADFRCATAEDFVATLAELGSDRDMLMEAVHGATNKIDSRHFAEEFLRRRKLADKGLVDASALLGGRGGGASPHAAAGTGQAGGGWSEVAKKGPVAKEAAAGGGESQGAFRVVPAKKKGGKR
ncbi:kinesin-like protein [Teratosphaeriaceae sp. CCFEE 6253]|nr:kinesin-like protein [Teratosphaeriaceae sp. CCFEE 6253]